MTPLEHTRILEETWIAKIEFHASLTSTNDRALELAKFSGIEVPMLVIADEQTAGRGRGGNRWWTGAGSLAFSLLFDTASAANISIPSPLSLGEGPGVKAESRLATPLIGLAAGLAVIEAIRLLLVDSEIGLHWPNDVFAAGRKLAGILVEVLPDRKTIVGIGLNVNDSIASAPLELQSLATTLFDLTQIPHDRVSLLIAILNQLQPMLALARTSPTILAAAADAVCLQKNQQLQIQWGPTVYSGLCRGIDDAGAILLETDNGMRAFPSGVILKT